MAEKNTLSILETIKKKMNSFDRKNAKDIPISDMRKELDYGVPPKNQTEEKPLSENAIEEKSKSSVPQFQAEDEKIDNFNFNDFDLDDENKIIQNSSTNSASTVSETEDDEEEMDIQDLEDYEDEEEFAEDLDDEKEELVMEISEDEIQKPEIHEDLESEEIKESDDFDFTQDALPSEAESEKIEETPIPTEDFLNIDLDPTGPLFSSEKTETEMEVEKKEIVEEIAEAATEAKNEASEIEDEIFKLPSTAETKVEEIKASEHDDFDELHNDLASDGHHEISVESNILSDDLKFDESYLENSTSKTQKILVSQTQAKVSNPGSDDLNLVNLEKNSSQAESEQKLSAQDEIDLEFEKEIMGLKPEVVNSVLQQKTEEKISDQAITQQSLSSQQQVINQNLSAVTFSQNSLRSEAENFKKNSIVNDLTIVKTTESIRKLVDAKNVVNGISAFSQSPAFTEIAVQLMEPKLDKWLNDNLPELVENIVREEIKKIIPK